MAYTKAPAVATYSTERVDFTINPLHRSGTALTKDARLINMMVEVFTTPDKENTKVFVKSRPGLASVYQQTNGRARGLYYWVFNGVGSIIYVIGNKVYTNNTLMVTLSTTAGPVNFTEFVDDVQTTKLIMLDGTNGYIWTDPVVAPTQITSALETAWTLNTVTALGAKRRPTVDNTYVYTATVAGTTAGAEPAWPTVVGTTVVDGTVTWVCDALAFPSPHIPMPVFLDGYLFVAKSGTQDIYNSDLNSPGTWTSTDYISAEMYPDKIVALSKNNNYIYAIGSSSIEYLYDNAAVGGSPLARHDSAVQQFGAAAPATVVQTEKEVILVGETDNGGHTVWTIDGFKEQEIGTPAIRSIFRAEGANLASANAHCIRVSGQKLYIITLTSMSLVYSFDTKMWYEWYSGSNNETNFVGSHAHDGPNGVPYILHYTAGTLMTISEDNHLDLTNPIVCQIITPKYDFGTYNRKMCSRLALIGDVPTTSGTGNALTVSWSDNDYVTWSTPRTISFDYDYPVIAQLGNFRRRAFRLTYNQPYLLRLEAMDLDINKGSQ